MVLNTNKNTVHLVDAKKWGIINLRGYRQSKTAVLVAVVVVVAAAANNTMRV